MQSLGSDTSRTLRGPGFLISNESQGGGNCICRHIYYYYLQASVDFISRGLTGIPAGKNLSKLWTGMIKQSLSNVDNDIGSFRKPELLAPKLTVFREKRRSKFENYIDIRSVQLNFNIEMRRNKKNFTTIIS